MSKGTLHPSTIEGIKSLAKDIKSAEGLKHFDALNRASVAAGYQNFPDAQRKLSDRSVPKAQHLAYLSSHWRDRETGELGQEVLVVGLSMPLAKLMTPVQLRYVRYLARCVFAAPDHLAAENTADSQSAARRWACGAARTLQFADASGLRPSRSTSKGYPGGQFRNAMPGRDHDSVWYDPKAKAHVVIDEPYSSRSTGVSEERRAWAERHGWEIAQPAWPGMYNPDGGCCIYLATNSVKGYPLTPILKALAALPRPPVEAAWEGQTIAASPIFVSPASQAKQEAAKIPTPRRKPGPVASVAYHTMFGKVRRRPKGRLTVASHAEVGYLLQEVISATWTRPGVRKPLEIARTTLDDWLQLEYSKGDLSDDDFFKMYYGAVVHRSPSKSAPESRDELKSGLDRVTSVLQQGYPACPPLSSVLKSIDASRNALLRW